MLSIRFIEKLRQREAENKAAMDLLMLAYQRRTLPPMGVDDTPETATSKLLYEDFYSKPQAFKESINKQTAAGTYTPQPISGYTITSRALTANEFLLNATTAEELLKLAGVVKPVNYKPRYEYRSRYIYHNRRRSPNLSPPVISSTDTYGIQRQAAIKLINDAKDVSRVGGTSFFNFKQETDSAELEKRYNIDKFTPIILEELAKKHSALGSLQRGLLNNETVDTSDDEKVLYSTNKSFAVDQELKNLKDNFKSMVDKINLKFTEYGQYSGKLGSYQSAYLSEESMLKQMAQDIRSTYTTYGGVKEEGEYMGDQYYKPSILNETVPNENQFTDFLNNLPTLNTL